MNGGISEVSSDVIKEACVETLDQCLYAQSNGASRIELCMDLAKGGTTPNYGFIKKAKEILNIPIYVIIRPRGGNFVYSDDEIDIMLYDIKMCKNLDVDGYVFGILNEYNEIDVEQISKLIKEIINCSKWNKQPSLTFHMAFDEIEEDKKLNSIKILDNLGFDRILTKGSKSKALEGIENIKQYIEFTSLNNLNIKIMPGGGITKENYLEIVKYTGCKEVHGTKIV